MERTSLSKNEYYALLELFGLVNSFNQYSAVLEQHCRSTPNGWRDLRLLTSTAERLMEKILLTVPLKRLTAIQKDLHFARCELKVVPDYTVEKEKDGFAYVSNNALSNVVERLVNWECMLCDKSKGNAKQCKVLKDIQALYPWDFSEKPDGCALQGLMSVMED